MASRSARAPARVDRRIESLRRQLPLPTYLSLMHTAATTGYLPVLGADGLPVPRGEDAEPLPMADRLKVLQYLVDKAMPNIRLEGEAQPEDVKEVLAAPESLSTAGLTAFLARDPT